MNPEVLAIIEQLSREKGIDRAVLIDALKMAILTAAQKSFPGEINIETEFDEETGEIQILVEKTVANQVIEPNCEISLKDASKLTPDARLGETVWVPQTLENYGRIAAQLAKQVIMQKVREAEIETVFNEFQDKRGDLVNGIVQRFERGDIFVDLGKVEGLLPRREQVFRETFNRGERIRAYVLEIRKSTKNAYVILSRTHVGLIRRLFELEVPEIGEGMVEIMGIVREPNGRTKIAVKTNDRDIDAVGACVGMRGMRVQSIVQELRGEKIDIVEYSEEAETFVRNALSPAKISRILINHKEQSMSIIVPDDQMSLAIGKKGQNVKLAAKLVKWKLDIQGESEARALLDKESPLKLKSPEEKMTSSIEKDEKLDDSLIQVLLDNEIKCFDDIVSQGEEGLVGIDEIEEEQASQLVELAQSYLSGNYSQPIIANDSFNEVSEEIEDENSETETDDEETSKSDAQADDEEKTDSDETEKSVDDLEYSVDELELIDPDIVQKLKASGFQTLAELSVTPEGELLEIDGIDEATAKSILSQARQHTDSLENAS
jgi:transcription termination/antitermination protein NusA